MTILFLSRLFYPHIGGVEKHVLAVGETLVKKGNRVIVITEKFEKKQKEKDKIKGIKIYRISVDTDEKTKKFIIWKWLWKNRVLIKEADLVHAHDIFFWFLPFKLIYPRKKFFITFHGFETKFPLSKRSVILRKMGEKLSKGNICVGDYLTKWYKTKANFIIYGGANNGKWQMANGKWQKNTTVRILFVGRLEQDTGITIYLETLEKLKEKKFNFEFQAIGDGSLKSNVAQYGKVNGFVKDVDSWLKWADVVFSSSYQSILEGLSAGKPVFAAYNNPLKEDYLKMSPFANFITVTDSAGDLSEKIINRVNNQDEDKIKKGYNWASKQNWEWVTSIYQKLWKI